MSLLIFLLLLVPLADAKIAITATGSNTESQVDSRFGRAAWYMIYDPAEGSWQAIDHSDMTSTGAGANAAAELRGKGVKVVITGQCGPKALAALQSAGIKVYRASASTVAGALRDFEAGRLKPIQ